MNIRRSLAFSFAESYLNLLVQVATSMVIARLLTPTELGKFSVGMVVIGVAHMLRDLGIGSYLIQAKTLEDKDIRAVSGLAILTSWSVGACIFLGRDAFAAFYGEPAIAQILGWLSLNFALLPFSSLVFPLLAREMKFKTIFLVNASANAVSAVATVWMVVAGFGYMGLVWGALVNTVVTVILATAVRPWSTFLLPSLRGSRKILNFGGKFSASLVVGQLGGSLSELVVAKTLGFSSVAIFSKAQTIVNVFALQFLEAVSKVYYPMVSRQHHAQGSPAQSFIQSSVYISAISVPFYGFVALNAEAIVFLMFGPQWVASAGLVPVMVLGGMLHSLYSLAPPTLHGVGLPGRVLRAELFIQTARIIPTVGAALISLSALAVAAVINSLIGYLTYMWFLRQHVQLNWAELLGRLLRQNGVLVLIALLPAALLRYFRPWPLDGGVVDAAFSLGASSLLFAASWLLALKLAGHPMWTQVADLVAGLVARLRPGQGPQP